MDNTLLDLLNSSYPIQPHSLLKILILHLLDSVLLDARLDNRNSMRSDKQVMTAPSTSLKRSNIFPGSTSQTLFKQLWGSFYNPCQLTRKDKWDKANSFTSPPSDVNIELKWDLHRNFNHSKWEMFLIWPNAGKLWST